MTLLVNAIRDSDALSLARCADLCIREGGRAKSQEWITGVEPKVLGDAVKRAGTYGQTGCSGMEASGGRQETRATARSGDACRCVHSIDRFKHKPSQFSNHWFLPTQSASVELGPDTA